ncbi:LapB repeat-containing protein [Erysipelothrix sp. HDW6C]|uniref:LapB repeat-containing protein n=1 Tax=Erysipelothrix sp. HDW6C TaxID=2714930 RepID=UPI00140D9132|nr:LapB repeat-containing protein [Erysipelothrix sp. HDW6C]QIK70401.1 LapB repeat-containing protein [Erysipelothrix sp. HDW6C]
MNKRLKKALGILLAGLITITSLNGQTVFANNDSEISNDDVSVKTTKTLSDDESNVLVDMEFTGKEGIEILDLTLEEEIFTLEGAKSYRYLAQANGEYTFTLRYVKNDVDSEEVNDHVETTDEEIVIEEDEPEVFEQVFTVVVNEFNVEVNEEVESILPLEQASPSIDIQQTGVQVGNDYVITQGNLTVTIYGYNPSVGMQIKQEYDFRVEADYLGDDKNVKEIEIKLAPGMSFSKYEVKSDAIEKFGELDMESTYVNFYESVEKPVRHEFYPASLGTVKYTVVPTSTKSDLTRTKISIDPFIYYGEKKIENAIEVSTSINGTVVDSISESVLATGDYMYKISYNSSLDHTMVEGDESIIDYNNEKKGVSGYSDSAFYPADTFAAEETYSIYYPIGMKFIKATNSNGKITNVVYDDEIGHAKITLTNIYGAARVGLHLDGSFLEPGIHQISGPEVSSVTMTTYDGTVIHSENETKPSIHRKIIVIDPIDIENRLSFVSSNTSYSSNIADDYFDLNVPIKVYNDVTSIKENQFLHIKTTANYQTAKISLPFNMETAQSKVIRYKTNQNNAWRVISSNEIEVREESGSRNITQISIGSVGLNTNEFFTEVEIELGDVEKGYEFSTSEIGYTSAHAGMIGRLAKDTGNATMTVQTYSRDESGQVHPGSINSKDHIIRRGAVSGSVIGPNIANNTIFAGDKKTVSLSLGNNLYHYTNGVGIKQASIFFKLPDGLSIDRESFQIKNRFGDLYDYEIGEEYSLSNGERYMQLDINSPIGGYFGADSATWFGTVTIKYDYLASLSASGSYSFSDLIFVNDGTNDLVLQRQSGFPAIVTDSNDINQNGSISDTFWPAQNNILSIISKNQLIIDTFIQPQGADRQPSFVPGDDQSAVGFTPGTIADYNIVMLNNLQESSVKEFTTYIPVPKAGNDFGTEFQSTPFDWNMKLNGAPTILITDADGNDITAEKMSDYEISYSNAATNKDNYVGAPYGSSPLADASMIRVVNKSGNMVPGEKFTVVFEYEVDEVAGAPETEARLGKVNDFRPYYFYDAGNAGWDSGSRVGARLEIGEVSGFVFEDVNANGIYDSGDTFLAGKTVVLYKKDTTGKFVEAETTLTQAGGTYAFEGLSNGDFYVDFNGALDSGYEFTLKNKGTDVSVDSDVDFTGDNKGKTVVLDSTKKTSQSISAGLIKYDATQLKANITKTETTIIAKNGEDLAFTIEPAIFDSIKQSVKWTSSDATIASVSNGYVSGNAAGKATITLTIEDIYGNIASDTIEVTVTPNTPPVLELVGTEVDWEVMTTGFDAKTYIKSATDAEDAGLGVDDVVITLPSNMNLNRISQFTVMYELTDSDGNDVRSLLTVNVVDTTAPVITAKDVTLEVTQVAADHKTLEELTALATIVVSDNYDASVKPTIVGLDAVKQNIVGDYVVTVNAKDASNNEAIEVEFIVHIVDKTAPVITVGEAIVDIEINGGTTAEDFLVAAQVTISDNSGVTITPTHDFAIVDQTKLGTTTVTITAKDAAGNSETKTVTVNVIDTTKPVLVVNNLIVNIEVNDIDADDIMILAGASATDNSLEPMVLTSDFDTVVNMGVLGKYQVTISAKDSSGNTSSQIVEVNIKDETDPTLTAANADLKVEINSVLTEADFMKLAKLTFDDNSGVKPTITTTFSSVDLSQLGETLVTITATDGSGNATDIIVKVTVEDTIAPELTVLNSNVSLEINGNTSEEAFRKAAGITATDNSNAVTITTTFDQVDQSIVGETIVTVTATDEAGNVTTANVTVKIEDTIAPVIETTQGDIAINIDTPISEADFLALVDVTAHDNSLGNVTITTDFDIVVDQIVPGAEYQVTVTATDESGNASTVIITVTMVDDVAPTIDGGSIQTYVVDSVITEADFYANIGLITSDNAAEAYPVTVTSDFDLVDFATIGEYTVTITATDFVGNTATHTVIVTIHRDATFHIDAKGIVIHAKDLGTLLATGDIETTILKAVEAKAWKDDALEGIIDLPVFIANKTELESFLNRTDHVDGESINVNLTTLNPLSRIVGGAEKTVTIVIEQDAAVITPEGPVLPSTGVANTHITLGGLFVVGLGAIALLASKKKKELENE